MRLPVFYMTAWGSFLLSSCLLFKVHAVPLSEQRSPYSREVMQCWLTRANTASPGRSTGFGPVKDNFFSSRQGEQQITGGRSPCPPGSFSQRWVSGEDTLLGRHFGKAKTGTGCDWEGSFPLSGLMKGIWYGEFLFLGEMILNIQR